LPVERPNPLGPAYRRTVQASGAVVVLVGIAALAGWATGDPVLMGVRARYIPMAPNTALAFIALGGGLVLVTATRGGRVLAAILAAPVAMVALLSLVQYLGGSNLGVDRWFLQVREGRSGLAPTGRMSLPTASAMLAVACALALQSSRPGWASAGHVIGACGVLSGMTGLIFALGYLFSPNAALLYGTESIPMALNTALCFVGLGVGLAAGAGPESFPLQRLSGPTMRARLLRIFLPLVVGTVGVVAWLTHLVTTGSGASTAAVSSAALAVAAIFLFGGICGRIADRVGRQIERAEAELQRANELLEIKVEERTRDLARANSGLAEALRETRSAHESLQRAHAELKETQSRMLQQARMASLGQTAAGVAHEINNPLAFVSNNLFLLKREVAGLHDILRLYQQAEHTLAQYQRDLHDRISSLAQEVDLPYVLENLDSLLERSRGGLKRIQKIVTDLRDFAHLEEAEFQEADLNEGIGTTVRLMQNIADARHVSLTMELAPLPRITCYPAKLNLVAQSLVSNAIDACEAGGHVAVSTRSAEDAIEVEVADDGCGILPAIRDRIFDPFFTTKAVGKGTGLGLAISYGIVKDHGGTIAFESAPGQGTRFLVRLPVVSPARDRCSEDSLAGAADPASAR
jgi:signal transduction histidine kinase